MHETTVTGTVLTVVEQPVVGEDAKGQADKVQEEVPVVVDADAVVHPRAVAGLLSVRASTHLHRNQPTHWSCLATQRWHLLQCLLRSGVLIMHVTQKLASSYFHSLSKSSMTARCSAMPFS